MPDASSFRATKKLKTRYKKFGNKICEGISMGYRVNAGLAWGDGCQVLVARTFRDTPVNHLCHVLKVHDVFTVDKLSFPVKDGAWKAKPPALEEVKEGEFLKDDEAKLDSDSDSSPSDPDEMDEGEQPAITGPDKEDSEDRKDEWMKTCDPLVRIHRIPRNAIFCPGNCDDPCPWPLENFDVYRHTNTTSHSDPGKKENDMFDSWCGIKEIDERPRFSELTGTTTFRFVRSPPKKGHYWCDGNRHTKIHSGSLKPRDCWPEGWARVAGNPKAQRETIEFHAKQDKMEAEAFGLRDSPGLPQTSF